MGQGSANISLEVKTGSLTIEREELMSMAELRFRDTR
jgi:hypothetical protein